MSVFPGRQRRWSDYSSRERETGLAEITILYWRDMPAQVIAGKGRRGVKLVLPERFEQAIDRAAMASGAVGTDAYLADWRRGEAYAVPGEDRAAAEAEAARIEAEFDPEKLKALVAAGGWAR
jgi:Virulence factor